MVSITAVLLHKKDSKEAVSIFIITSIKTQQIYIFLFKLPFPSMKIVGDLCLDFEWDT